MTRLENIVLLIADYSIGCQTVGDIFNRSHKENPLRFC